MNAQQRMFPARQWYARYVPHTWGGMRESDGAAYVQCAVCSLWLDAVRWFGSCPGAPTGADAEGGR